MSRPPGRRSCDWPRALTQGLRTWPPRLHRGQARAATDSPRGLPSLTDCAWRPGWRALAVPRPGCRRYGSADSRLASVLVANTAYSLEHDAAAALPPLSPQLPLRSAKLLLGDRRWLLAFAAETAGWLTYVAAQRLAPLSLLQAVAASGSRSWHSPRRAGSRPRLARREQVEMVLAATGLVMADSGSGSSSDRSMPWPAAPASIVPLPVSAARWATGTPSGSRARHQRESHQDAHRVCVPRISSAAVTCRVALLGVRP